MNKIKSRESQNVEYKSEWHDEYLKWICGFANAQGAVMYFGVNNDHEVIGLDNVDRLMEDIPNKIVTTMGIVVDVNLHEMDGLEYIEIYVEPSNIPINYRGKYYYRSGSTMQELRGPALQQFVLKKMGRSWDDIPNEFATIKDLDRKAVKYFLDNGIAAERIDKSEAKASTARVVQNLGLMTEDGKLKNAALLLFAKNPRRYFTCVEFKIGRFRTDESDLIIQDVIEGNIIEMTDHIVKVLKAKYLTSPIHYEGMKRREPLEVPEDALREILYNAIAHKDYTGAPIQMRVWDDYVEIWNEGELPSGLTPESLLKKHSSHPRNKNIANAFFKAGFIESWGRGYEKIRRGFEKVGLPMPKIESVEGGVRVTFQRNNVSNSRKEVSPKDNSVGNRQELPDVLKDVQKNVQKNYLEQLTERQLNTLKLIAETPNITLQVMSKRLRVSVKTIQRDFSAMRQLGIAIVRKDGKTYGEWEIQVN